MRIKQIIPKGQVKIIREALELLKTTTKLSNPHGEVCELCDKEFDILQLLAILDNSKVSVSLPIEKFKNFSGDHGVDFPLYTQKPRLEFPEDVIFKLNIK